MEICDECGAPQDPRKIIHINTSNFVLPDGRKVCTGLEHLCAKCLLEKWGLNKNVRENN